MQVLFLCVLPQGYKLHSHAIEHVLKCNEAILLIGMASVTKRIVAESNLIRLSLSMVIVGIDQETMASRKMYLNKQPCDNNRFKNQV